MFFTTTAYNDVQVVHLPEKMTMSNASNLKQGLIDLINLGHEHVVLDLAGVNFTDSSGLAVLVAAYKASQAKGTRLVLLSPQPSVQSLLELTRLQELFEIYKDVKAAVTRIEVK
jgi:anti-sigma B factor antagonist